MALIVFHPLAAMITKGVEIIVEVRITIPLGRSVLAIAIIPPMNVNKMTNAADMNMPCSFEMAPSDFALGIYECIQAGASLIGGCCGTSPAHIQAIADLLGR